MPITISGDLTLFIFNGPDPNAGGNNNEYFGEFEDTSSNITITGSSGFGGLGIGEGFVQTQGFFAPPPAVDPLNIVFRPVRDRIAARYSGSVIVEILDSPFQPLSASNPQASASQANPDLQSFVATWNAIRIPSDPTDQWLTVTVGMECRLDIISQAVYNRPDLYWCLAQANDIVNPFERPMAGDKIRIPSLARILRIFGQVATSNELTQPNA